MTKRKAIPKKIRDKLLVDCKHRCVVCHEKTPHVHHIVPVEEGGTNDYDNLVVLCPTCHDNVHMRHISPSQLRLYKHQWISLCSAGLVVASLDEKQKRFPSALYLLEESHGGKYGFIDPTPFVNTVADLVEHACSALAIPENEVSKICPEMFKFYQLLVRMKKNCARMRVILESNLQPDGEKSDIFEKTDLHRIVEDQSQTVFTLFEHLITRADLFEVFIPGFSDHLWSLLNCREGVLRSIIYGHYDSETSVELFVKVDQLAKEAGLEWTPYFEGLHDSEYHPELNRAYGVEYSRFIVVDMSTKNTRAYQYVSKHLKGLETTLEIAKDKFAKLLRDNFNLRELVGE